MARNRYFNQYNTNTEQNVLEDLIIESIKMYGIQGYYLPRNYPNLDRLYGEDPTSTFDDAIEMELFVKSFDGFQGQEDFISKFGLQIDESITFVIAQKRFDQSLKTSLLTEYGYNFINEDGDQLLYNVADAWDYASILRPREGDLVWIPMMGYMYEIRFTENIENFFQLGKLFTYELRCDRFEYSSEKIDTDVTEIDAIEDQYSLSTENLEKALLEDGDFMLNEDGTLFVNEQNSVITYDAKADNEVIGEKAIDDDVLDFSEMNPFALTRAY